jgi:hypothetical protein
MAQLVIAGDQLIVRLSAFEKVAALHRDLRFDVTAIRSIDVVEKPWELLRGWRAAGLALRRQIAVATFRGPTASRFAVLRGGQRAVQVTFNRGLIADVLVGSADAAAEVQRLRDQTGR